MAPLGWILSLQRILALFLQVIKIFSACVHILLGVSPTKIVQGELTTCPPTRNAWILPELNSAFHPRDDSSYYLHDFCPGSMSWMVSQTSASSLQKSLGSFTFDVRCDYINQESKNWSPPSSQPTVTALADFGDVRSCYKYINRYFADTKDFASVDTGNNHYPFEDAIARKAPCSPYFRYNYSLPPKLANEFYQQMQCHALFPRGDVQIMRCQEFRDDNCFYVVPTTDTMQKDPGDMLPWEIMGTPIGQTKSLRLQLTSAPIRDKYRIFCRLNTAAVVTTGTLTPLQTVAQALF